MSPPSPLGVSMFCPDNRGGGGRPAFIKPREANAHAGAEALSASRVGRFPAPPPDRPHQISKLSLTKCQGAAASLGWAGEVHQGRSSRECGDCTRGGSLSGTRQKKSTDLPERGCFSNFRYLQNVIYESPSLDFDNANTERHTESPLRVSS